MRSASLKDRFEQNSILPKDAYGSKNGSFRTQTMFPEAGTYHINAMTSYLLLNNICH